jgi:hypothetical protein
MYRLNARTRKWAHAAVAVWFAPLTFRSCDLLPVTASFARPGRADAARKMFHALRKHEFTKLAQRFFLWSAMAEAARQREFAAANASALRMLLRWRRLPDLHRLKRLARAMNIWSAKIAVRKRKARKVALEEQRIAAAAAALLAMQNASAVKVQAAWRGFNARSHMLYYVHRDRVEGAVVVIQCAWRQLLAKRELQARVQRHAADLAAKHAAATKLQRIFRGAADRRRVRILRMDRSKLLAAEAAAAAAAAAAAQAEAEAAAAAAAQAEAEAAAALAKETTLASKHNSKQDSIPHRESVYVSDDDEDDDDDVDVGAALGMAALGAGATNTFLLHAQNRAANKVQSVWRGHCARKDARKLRRLRDAERQRQKEGWSGFQVYSEPVVQQQAAQLADQQQYTQLQQHVAPEQQQQLTYSNVPGVSAAVDVAQQSQLSAATVDSSAVSAAYTDLSHLALVPAEQYNGYQDAYHTEMPAESTAVVPWDAAAYSATPAPSVDQQYYGYDAAYYQTPMLPPAQAPQSYEYDMTTAAASTAAAYDTTAALVPYAAGTESNYGYGYDTNGYATGYDVAAYTAAGYDMSAYAAPAYTAAAYDASGYATGAYDASAYAASGYDASGYAASGYDASGYAASGYDASTYDSSGQQYYDQAGATDEAALAAQWNAYYAAGGVDPAAAAQASYYSYDASYDHSAYDTGYTQ